MIDFFESHGMPTKTERGNRVFPVSDHSSDVTAALERALKEKKVTVRLHTKVEYLLTEEQSHEEQKVSEQEQQILHRKTEKTGTGRRITGVALANGSILKADAVIVATGGISYPSTGATGD